MVCGENCLVSGLQPRSHARLQSILQTRNAKHTTWKQIFLLAADWYVTASVVRICNSNSMNNPRAAARRHPTESHFGVRFQDQMRPVGFAQTSLSRAFGSLCWAHYAGLALENFEGNRSLRGWI